MKILVTCPPMLGLKHEFVPYLESLGIEAICPDFVQVMSEEALCEVLPECDGWIIGDDPASARVVAAGAAGKFKAAVRWGIGVDNVDFSAFKKHDIPVVNTPGMFGKEVADIGLGYVIGLARHTFVIDREVRQGRWHKPIGHSLEGKNVGVIGYGDIGRNMVKRLLALDMIVTVWDPAFANQEVVEEGNVSFQKWPLQSDKMDFLVFTCALTSSNHHMLGSDVINQLKAGVSIVNVARGPLIDESALIHGLASGVVGSAALDVFEEEPLAKTNPLINEDRVIFGSHNASNTIEAVRKTNDKSIDILMGFLGVSTN